MIMLMIKFMIISCTEKLHLYKQTRKKKFWKLSIWPWVQHKVQSQAQCSQTACENHQIWDQGCWSIHHTAALHLWKPEKLLIIQYIIPNLVYWMSYFLTDSAHIGYQGMMRLLTYKETVRHSRRRGTRTISS